MTETEQGRNLTVQDVFTAIRTLDDATCSDSTFFRWRLRLWMRHEQEIEEQRVAAEVGRD